MSYYDSLSLLILMAWHDSSVGCASAWYADGCGFDPHIRQHSFMEIGHEIISAAILSLPLMQEGQLSGTKHWYTAKEACPRTVWIG